MKRTFNVRQHFKLSFTEMLIVVVKQFIINIGVPIWVGEVLRGPLK